MPGMRSIIGRKSGDAKERTIKKNKRYNVHRTAWKKNESKKMQHNIRAFLKRKVYEVMWFEQSYPSKRFKTDSQEAMDAFIKLFQKFTGEYDIVADIGAMSINGKPHTELLDVLKAMDLAEGVQNETSSAIDLASAAAATAQYIASKFDNDNWIKKINVWPRNIQPLRSTSRHSSNQEKPTPVRNVLQSSWLKCISDKIMEVFSTTVQQPSTSVATVPFSSLFDNNTFEANHAQAPLMGYRSVGESSSELQTNQLMPATSSYGQYDQSTSQKIPVLNTMEPKTSGKCDVDINNNKSGFIIGAHENVKTESDQVSLSLPSTSRINRDENNGYIHDADLKTEYDNKACISNWNPSDRVLQGRLIRLEFPRQKSEKEEVEDNKSDTSDLSDISDLAGSVPLADVDECRLSDLNHQQHLSYLGKKDDDDDSKSDTSGLSDISDLVGSVPLADVDECRLSDLNHQQHLRYLGKENNDDSKSDTSDVSDISDLPGAIPLPEKDNYRLSKISNLRRRRYIEEDDNDDRKSDTSDLSDISDIPGAVPLSDELGASDIVSLVGPVPDSGMLISFISNIRKDMERDEALAIVFERRVGLSDKCDDVQTPKVINNIREEVVGRRRRGDVICDGPSGSRPEINVFRLVRSNGVSDVQVAQDGPCGSRHKNNAFGVVRSNGAPDVQVAQDGPSRSRQENNAFGVVRSVCAPDVQVAQDGPSGSRSENNVFWVVRSICTPDVQIAQNGPSDSRPEINALRRVRSNTKSDVQGTLFQEVKNEELEPGEISTIETYSDMQRVNFVGQQLRPGELSDLPEWGGKHSGLPSFQNPQAANDTGMLGQDCANNTVSASPSASQSSFQNPQAANDTGMMLQYCANNTVSSSVSQSVMDNAAAVHVIGDNATGEHILNNLAEVKAFSNGYQISSVPEVRNTTDRIIAPSQPVSPQPEVIRQVESQPQMLHQVETQPRVFHQAESQPQVFHQAEIQPQMFYQAQTQPEVDNIPDDIPSPNTSQMDPELKPRSILKASRARSNSSYKCVSFSDQVTCSRIPRLQFYASQLPSTSGNELGTPFTRGTIKQRHAVNNVVSFKDDLPDISKDRENSPTKKNKQASIFRKRKTEPDNDADYEQPFSKIVRIGSGPSTSHSVKRRSTVMKRSLAQRSRQRTALGRCNDKMMDCESGLLSNEMDVDVRPSSSKRHMDMDISEVSNSKRHMAMEVSDSTSNMQVDDPDEKMEI